MKIPHRKKDFFLPLMLLVSCLLTLVCFASHASGTSTFLSKGLSLITTPLRSATTGIYDYISAVGDYFEDVKVLKKENQQLKLENKALQKENSKAEMLKRENEILYGFLELKKEHNDYKLNNANIISKSESGYMSTFTIDKGSFHGIDENMPVITSSGALAGVTYSVETNSSRCISILSYDTKVGVYDENTGEVGILSGSFETFKDRKCLMEGLAVDTSVKEGDLILTSGLGNIYPRGLTIGRVEGFINDLGSHTKSAVICLDESIPALEDVMVITSFKRTYE